MAEVREASVFYSLQKNRIFGELHSQKCDAKFCDVIMKVCETEIYAHSNILAAASPYFCSFLSQDLPRVFSQRSPQVIEIQIDGNEPGYLYEDAVTRVVDFIYTGRMHLSITNVAQVCEIAKIMQLEELVKFCEHMLLGLAPDDSVFGVSDVESQTEPTVLPPSEESDKQTQLEQTGPSLHVALERVSDVHLIEDDRTVSEEPHLRKKRGRPKRSKEAEDEEFLPDSSKRIKLESPDNKRTDMSPKVTDTDNSRDFETPQSVLSSVDSSQVRRSSRTFKPTAKAKTLNMDMYMRPKTETPTVTPKISGEEKAKGSDKSPATAKTPTKSQSSPSKSTSAAPKKTLMYKIRAVENGEESKEEEQIGRTPKSKTKVPLKKKVRVEKKEKGTEVTSGEEKKAARQVEEGMEESAKPAEGVEDAQVPQEEVAVIQLGAEVKMERDRDEAENARAAKAADLPYKCDHCTYATDNVYRFRKHLLRHGMAKFQCSECDFKTAAIREYKNHHRVHLAERNICHFCMNQFDDKEAMEEHLHTHKGPKPWICTVCGYRFKLQAQLLLHMPKHSDDRPFKCEECGAGFKWKHALKYHMLIHTGKKEHLCDICGYATAHKGQLKAHRLIHTGDTIRCPFANKGCPFMATKAQNMKHHLLTHTKEKPHQCEVCGQAFSLAKNMRRHRMLHSQARPLCCDLCPYVTSRVDKLKDHKFKEHQVGAPPGKKIRISDMVAASMRSQQEGEESQEEAEPKETRQIIVMGHVQDILGSATAPDYKGNLEKGLEDIAVKNEAGEMVTQAVLIDASGAVRAEENSTSLVQGGQHIILETIDGRVLIPGEGAQLGYIDMIDKDGNYVAVTASEATEEEQPVEPAGQPGMEEVQQVTGQVIEGQVVPVDAAELRYAELVLPADQVQALVDQVTSDQPEPQ